VRQVGNSPVGAAVRVTVMRDGKSQTIKVVLGRREDASGAQPETAPAQEDDAEPDTKDLLGLTVTPLTDEMREALGADKKLVGLAVTNVEEASEAYEKGLRAGDIITEANQQKIEDISALEREVAAVKDAGRKSLLLLVRRAGDPRFVALSLTD
jgi:serine protease Do